MILVKTQLLDFHFSKCFFCAFEVLIVVFVILISIVVVFESKNGFISCSSKLVLIMIIIRRIIIVIAIKIFIVVSPIKNWSIFVHISVNSFLITSISTHSLCLFIVEILWISICRSGMVWLISRNTRVLIASFVVAAIVSVTWGVGVDVSERISWESWVIRWLFWVLWKTTRWNHTWVFELALRLRSVYRI